MPEIVTTVKAKSAYGIKAEVWGDEWANWSKPEFRGEPFNTSVKAGDRVQVTYNEADTGKVYISTIDLVTGGTMQRHGGAGDEGQGPDQSFPPEEDFPPDATGAPVEPSLDRDRLIVRQVAIKAACEALAVSGLEPEVKAERITNLAGILEDWVYRG